ncbi:hypothetical protein C0992_005658 [Termitomyces sp. T32_za158]|nr:hypothetical protein C0992_005658 [Termitomyces sp. T32_za158]
MAGTAMGLSISIAQCILFASSSGRSRLRVTLVRLFPYIYRATADAPADVYCYACDDGKSDPGIATHLASLGINVQTFSKAENAMTELARSSRDNDRDHAPTCFEPLPASCIQCQLCKFADATHCPICGSERETCREVEKEDGERDRMYQAGLKPSGLKTLVGRGHAEFSTMKQQDTEELL